MRNFIIAIGIMLLAPIALAGVKEKVRFAPGTDELPDGSGLYKILVGATRGGASIV